MSEPEIYISLEDGKYTIILDEGGFRALRYSAPWRDLTGDKMALALAQEVVDLRRELAKSGQQEKRYSWDDGET